MNLLEKAIAIALEAHSGQSDKAGKPYILHPLRVMFGVSSETEQIVAVLHDVVEDSQWTLAQLSEAGFPENIVTAVECLTRQENEDYFAFIERIVKNQLAISVKLSDLRDNMNLARNPNPTERDFQRLQKYEQAFSILNGNSKEHPEE